MSEQGTQDSINTAEPVASPPIIHKPDSRADVDRKKSATSSKPDQKFPIGKKIRKENAQGILEYEVHVVSARYDPVCREWMYTLSDWEKKAMAGETEETKLD